MSSSYALRLDLGHISGQEAGHFQTEGEVREAAHDAVDEGALSATVYVSYPGGMEIFYWCVEPGDPRPAFLLPLKETLRLRPSALAERMLGAQAVT